MPSPTQRDLSCRRAHWVIGSAACVLQRCAFEACAAASKVFPQNRRGSLFGVGSVFLSLRGFESI
jgi:hypothetical protein